MGSKAEKRQQASIRGADGGGGGGGKYHNKAPQGRDEKRRDDVVAGRYIIRREATKDRKHRGEGRGAVRRASTSYGLVSYGI